MTPPHPETSAGRRSWDRFDNTTPTEHPGIRGRCPSCGHDTLFLGKGGYVTCSWLPCKDPGAATDLLASSARSRGGWEPTFGNYTGREMRRTVTYVLPVSRDFVVMALEGVASERARGDKVREQALYEAQRAVVEACTVCEGQGWTIGVETGDGHACDGTDASCVQNCPVPVPVQVQEQCEYCGRPSAAILALLPAAPPDGGSPQQ